MNERNAKESTRSGMNKLKKRSPSSDEEEFQREQESEREDEDEAEALEKSGSFGSARDVVGGNTGKQTEG